MAGIHADRGDTSHRLVSGEAPEIGMKVWDNDLKQGVIMAVCQMDDPCGYYCPAWHTIKYPDGHTSIMNCDRLTTRKPF